MAAQRHEHGDAKPRDPRDAKLVLVVDDDPAFRRDVCEILDSEGYRTVAAWDGREAVGLLLASKEKPSLIVLDLAMPEIDGIAFRRWQKSNRAYASIPVLILTGAPHVDELLQGSRVEGYLTKPVDVDALLEKVERLAG